MKKIAIVIAVVEIAFLSLAHAQVGFDNGMTTGAGKRQIGAFMTTSKTEYEFSPAYGSYGQKISRSIIGAYSAYGILESVDIYIAGGYISQVDIDQNYWSPDGSGSLIIGGLRHGFKVDEKLSVMVYAQYQYIEEDYGSSDQIVYPMGGAEEPTSTGAIDDRMVYPYPSSQNSREATYREVAVGIVANYAISEKCSIYAGIEVLPYRGGSIESTYTSWYGGPMPLPAESSGGTDVAPSVIPPDGEYIPQTQTTEEDARRNNIVGTRFGVSYAVENRHFYCEISANAEQTFTLGASVSF